jgi:hypothetical protein
MYPQVIYVQIQKTKRIPSNHYQHKVWHLFLLYHLNLHILQFINVFNTLKIKYIIIQLFNSLIIFTPYSIIIHVIGSEDLP